MSETKEPMKEYYGYKSEAVDEITYMFDNHEQAFDHAYMNGFFEGLFKEEMMEKDRMEIFCCLENELEDHIPFTYVPSIKKVA